MASRDAGGAELLGVGEFLNAFGKGWNCLLKDARWSVVCCAIIRRGVAPPPFSDADFMGARQQVAYL